MNQAALLQGHTMARYTLIVGTRSWSSWSLRPFVALKATGAPYETIDIRLRQKTAPTTRDQILNFSPSGRIPVLKIEENGQTLTVNVTPEKMPGENGDVGYRLGFTNKHVPTKVEHLGFADSVKQSFDDNLDDATMTFRVLKGLFTRHVSVKALSGPVGIAQQIDVAASNGTWSLLRFMSFISLQLGIFNLLPIPILDGGMILQ